MKVVLFANTDWYLYNFRRDLAMALRERGDEVILLSPKGEYINRLMEMGFRWVEFPLSRRGMNPLGELGSVYKLYQFYKKEKPTLVHHFTVKCVLYGSLAAHLAGVKAIINSITGLGYLFLPGSLLKNMLRAFIRAWYRFAMRGTQVIFENTEDQAVFLKNEFIHPEDGHLIPGVGVDIRRFVPTPEPEGKPVVLLASRLLWDKGVGEFVEAARSLRSEDIQVSFALAGRTDSGNPASIQTHKSKPGMMKASSSGGGGVKTWRRYCRKPAWSVFLHYREGLPTILIEAAACGSPIVATDVPGCRDAVINGVTGLLVNAKDATSLADAIRKLVTDPGLRKKMGAAGRALVEEKFSSNKILVQILSVYERTGKAIAS